MRTNIASPRVLPPPADLQESVRNAILMANVGNEFSMLPATRLRRNPDAIAAEVAGNAILLNVTTWTYVNFNETGSWLWQCLDEPRTFEWLSAAAEEQFEGVPKEIARDIEDFLRDLSEKGLVLTETAD